MLYSIFTCESGFLLNHCPSSAPSQNHTRTCAPTQVEPQPEGDPSLQPGSLTRTFEYFFVDNDSWPKVRTTVIQRQVLQLLVDGRLRLRITQTMPGLPQGVTKCTCSRANMRPSWHRIAYAKHTSTYCFAKPPEILCQRLTLSMRSPSLRSSYGAMYAGLAGLCTGLKCTYT